MRWRGRTGHQSDDERHFAVTARVEGEFHLARPGLLHLGDLLVVGAMIGPAVIAQERVGKDHVGDRDRSAVGELRFRAQRELDVAPVVRRFHALGDQPVEGEGLVIGAREQALIDVFAHALGRNALDDQGVETVEGTLHGEGRAAALGRLGIGIGKMRKPSGLERLAMHGKALLRTGRSAAREQEQAQSQEGNRGFQEQPRVAIDAFRIAARS